MGDSQVTPRRGRAGTGPPACFQGESECPGEDWDGQRPPTVAVAAFILFLKRKFPAQVNESTIKCDVFHFIHF